MRILEKRSGPGDPAAQAPPSAAFWRKSPFRIALASLLVLVPCFWHRHIQAGDLGSHLYNAWLAELIRQGEAPGLSIAPQRNNILFDWMLSGAGRLFGFTAAERIVVSVCVLIFFWGAFALISALARRRPWFLLPILAVVAYGWTFHMGFFNYYLALGLSFWALSMLLAPTVSGMGTPAAIAASSQPVPTRRSPLRHLRSPRILWVAPLLLLTYVAHPMAALWAGGAGVFLLLALAVPKRGQLPLVGLAVVAAVVVRMYLRSHYETAYLPLLQACSMNGSDQLVLRTAYRWLAITLGFGAVAAVACEYVACRRESGVFWERFRLPLQLYFLTLLAACALPDFLVMPTMGRFGFVLARLSLISAVAACGVLAAVRPRSAYALFCAAVAAAYFTLNFNDTAALDRMETRIGELLTNVGRDDRVLATLNFSAPGPGSRVLFQHMVDRQCIGRCWSYGNYEPATGHFRVRASPGNRIVATTKRDVDDMWGGGYEVKAADLPAWQLYQPGGDWTAIAIRPLAAGEKNGGPAR